MSVSLLDEHVDLIVVGAGAAGCVVAATAAKAGKMVTLLEAGPPRQLQDLTSSQIWARRLKWGGAPVLESGNLPIGHGFNSGFGTGGSALHQFGVWPRLHENDFKVYSNHARGLDWPISYQDLRPYYDRIQATVGISGDSRAEKWRPPADDYPLPPMPVFEQGKTIARGFANEGLATAPIPVAINSTSYNNRPGCLFDGWCDAGCPTGALANPLVTYLPVALSNGCQLVNHATVKRILHNKAGDRVVGVEYVDQQGSVRRLMADQVVLSAFAVQNAKLLLQSSSDKHPAGLSNHNDLVGRYLMTHPATSVYGLFPNQTMPHLGPTGGQLICQDGYADKAKPGVFGSYQWLIANALKPNDLLGIANTRPDIIGESLQPFMQKAAKHMGNMVCIGEDIAQAENRVTLSSRLDANGIPLASTLHNIGAETITMNENAVAQGLRVFRAAGAQEVWQGARFGMHIMGGTVMGSDPATSVADSYGRCHELENLYLAGPGLFPSSGAVNPTFTLQALAEHLLG